MRHPVCRRLSVLIVALGTLGFLALGSPGTNGVQAAPLAAPLAGSAHQARLSDVPLHECQDVWEAINPFAHCMIDPTHPVRDALGDALKQSLHDFALSTIDDIVSGCAAVVTWGGVTLLAQTPGPYSYAHATVIHYWGLCRLIADGALALLIMLCGFEIMLRTRVGSSYAGALEVLQTVLLVALLANVSLELIRLVIDVGNALCRLVGGALTLPALVANPDPATETVGHALFRLLYVVVAVLVLVQMFMRLALLDLLIIIAPLGILCAAHPRSRRWADLWSGYLTALILQQFLQILALRLSTELLTTLPGAVDPMAEILLGCASLALVFQLPHMLGGLRGMRALPTVAGMAGAAVQGWERQGVATAAAADRARQGSERQADRAQRQADRAERIARTGHP